MQTESDPPRPPAAILARGHLHPAILLLRLVDALRQAIVPIAFGVLLERWFLVLGIVLFVANLGYAVARYLTLEYTLTADELRIREGLLQRQERRIPLDRIQDLGFESTLLRRALGLSVVLVETASGRGVEARLDALGRADADHLRDVLLEARHAITMAATAAPTGAPIDGEPVAAAAPRAPTPEWLIHRSTAGELLLRGMTDLRLSAFVVTGFALLQFADQIGLAVQLRGAAQGFREWLLHFPPLVVAAALLGMLAVILAFGVATATIGNLVHFHGFTLVLRDEVLQRRFGLLTKRAKTLPRARIQRVTVEQPWLRRLLGLAVVKADSAGGSRGEGEDTTGGWDVVVPLARLQTVEALLPALLPGIEGEHFVWQRGAARLVVRTAMQGVLLTALVVPVLWRAVGSWALLGLGFAPFFVLLGILIWRSLGWSLGHDFLALRHGVVGRYGAYVPTAKVQAVVVRRGPLALLLGLADLTVYVAGGSPTRLPDLLHEDARRLQALIAARAAQAAATDW